MSNSLPDNFFQGQLTHPNGPIMIQLSYSTADIEESIFHTDKYAPLTANQPISNMVILTVHGELFVLQEEAPKESIPLTEKSGLFQIVGLDQQP